MNALLWAVAALLAAAFTIAGINHALRPKEQLKAQMPWTEDFSQGQLRGIGLLELLAAVGLILPPCSASPSGSARLPRQGSFC